MIGQTALLTIKHPFVDKLNRYLASEYAVGTLAFCSLLSALLGLEVFFFSLICIVGIYLCLFAEDFRLLVPMALYACVAISHQNNPNTNPNSTLYPQNGLWIVIVLAAVLAVLFVWRLSRLKGVFFKTKRKFLTGLLLLCGACLIGCFGTIENFWWDLRYVFVLAASLVALYYLLTVAIDWKKIPKDYFAWVLLFLGICVAAQLLELYLDGSIFGEAGNILRFYISVGWGTYNNIGVMLLIAMPGAFYLSVVRRKGFAFNLFGNFFYLCILLSNSRTCMLMGAVIYFLCMHLVLREKKNHAQNLAVFVFAFVALAFVLVFCWDWIAQLFQIIIDKQTDSSGRVEIYQKGARQFFASPIIGNGFFACDAYERWTVAGEELLPPLWHNTIIQMLACCGLIGLAAYVQHRVQTVLHCLEKPNLEKTFIGVCLFGFLLTNLLDCHFFLLGPGLFYSSFLAFFERAGANGERRLLTRKGGKIL